MTLDFDCFTKRGDVSTVLMNICTAKNLINVDLCMIFKALCQQCLHLSSSNSNVKLLCFLKLQLIKTDFKICVLGEGIR